jgi:hypothetical protein
MISVWIVIVAVLTLIARLPVLSPTLRSSLRSMHFDVLR